MVYFDYKKFSKFIKYLRYKHKMSQKELAERLGVSIRTVKRYETCERKVTLEAAVRLMDIFKFSSLVFSQYFKDDEE